MSEIFKELIDHPDETKLVGKWLEVTDVAIKGKMEYNDTNLRDFGCKMICFDAAHIMGLVELKNEEPEKYHSQISGDLVADAIDIIQKLGIELRDVDLFLYGNKDHPIILRFKYGDKSYGIMLAPRLTRE